MDQILEILIIDDEPVVHKTLGIYLTRSGYNITSNYNSKEALETLQKSKFDLVLLDIFLPNVNGLEILKKVRATYPDLPVVIISAHGNLELAIQALRLGASDFLTKPIRLLELDAIIEKTTRIGTLQNKCTQLRNTIGGMQSLENLREKNRTYIGTSQTAQMVRKQIQQAVDAQVNTILLTGETGTGKEVVARAIHFMSYSEEAPFIAVNCPSLTETLIEAELFGYEKGSFTNAAQARPGYFEMANEGTLFLDEIGDLALPLQASLLRVLETRQVRRIGAQKEIPIACKVIAATNVDLEKRIKMGVFRKDLFYRLNLFQIHLPPLRQRSEDILPLAHHFLQSCKEVRKIPPKGFSPNAEIHLQNYDYPGNVRELRNIIEQATIFCQEDQIESHHLNIGFTPPEPTPDAKPQAPSPTSPDAPLDRQTLHKTLEATRWNRREAAQKLGITYAKLRYWIQKYNLN